MTGTKHDCGKVRAGLVLGDFAKALYAVSDVGTFGAEKYSESNWLKVKDAEDRYDDAMLRHWLADKYDQGYDDESGILHSAHVAWNALAVLELRLRDGAALNRNAEKDYYEQTYEGSESGKAPDSRAGTTSRRQISADLSDASIERFGEPKEDITSRVTYTAPRKP